METIVIRAESIGRPSTIRVWGWGQALSACKSLANKLRFWAGDIMIGLNRRGPIFWDPGPIFEFNMPNPSVWYRLQPDMVRSDSCLSDGQKTAVLGEKLFLSPTY